jgi:hypothetical protein
VPGSGRAPSLDSATPPRLSSRAARYNSPSVARSFFGGVAAMTTPTPGTPRPEDRPPTEPTLDEPIPRQPRCRCR